MKQWIREVPWTLVVLGLSGCETPALEERGSDAAARTVEVECSSEEFLPVGQTCAADGDQYYESPFQYIPPADIESIPFLDVKDAPSGARYAIAQSVFIDEEGQVSKTSGLRELPQQPTSQEDLNRLMASKGGENNTATRPVLHPLLQATLEDLGEEEQQRVVVFLRGPQLPSVSYLRARAVAAGQVETQSDAWAVEQAAVQERRASIAEVTSPKVSVLEDLGLEVEYVCDHAPCVVVRGTKASIVALADDPDVLVVDPALAGEEDTNEINGIGIEVVYQNETAIDHSPSYTGDASTFWGVAVAVMEFVKFNDEHPVFKEGTSGSRILSSGRRLCNTTGCATVSSFTGGSAHATASAGLFVGDLTDGQHASISGSTDQRRRSSPGREARTYMYSLDVPEIDRSTAYVVALDDLPSRNPIPRIVSTSISVSNMDSGCLGMDSISTAVDEMLFENGIFFVNSAGNTPGTSSTCSVSAPGSAMGAFTVGAWGEEAPPNDVAAGGIYSDWCEARDAPLHPNSAWGVDQTGRRAAAVQSSIFSGHTIIRRSLSPVPRTDIAMEPAWPPQLLRDPPYLSTTCSK